MYSPGCFLHLVLLMSYLSFRTSVETCGAHSAQFVEGIIWKQAQSKAHYFPDRDILWDQIWYECRKRPLLEGLTQQISSFYCKTHLMSAELTSKHDIHLDTWMAHLAGVTAAEKNILPNPDHYAPISAQKGFPTPLTSNEPRLCAWTPCFSARPLTLNIHSVREAVRPI